MEMASIQHGDDHDRKVNKDNSCVFFSKNDQSFGHA